MTQNKLMELSLRTNRNLGKGTTLWLLGFGFHPHSPHQQTPVFSQGSQTIHILLAPQLLVLKGGPTRVPDTCLEVPAGRGHQRELWTWRSHHHAQEHRKKGQLI